MCGMHPQLQRQHKRKHNKQGQNKKKEQRGEGGKNYNYYYTCAWHACKGGALCSLATAITIEQSKGWASTSLLLASQLL